MGALAILGVILGLLSLGLSIYNTIVLKAELLTRQAPSEPRIDPADTARQFFRAPEPAYEEDDYRESVRRTSIGRVMSYEEDEYLG